MRSGELDAVDRKLIHALQIDPRASWKSLENAVGANASTLARRWARLSGSGLAWVTGHLRNELLAMVEIECEFTRLDAVVSELIRDPYVWTVELCSGSRNLVLMVSASDLADLSNVLTERLGRLEGLRTVHTHLLSEVHVDGSHWRMRELSHEEVSRVPPPLPPRPRAARHVPDDLKQIIVQEVWQDGRVPVAEIAERYDLAPQRVSDAIATLRHSGALRFRIDVARTATDWGVSAWYFVRAPSHLRDAIKHIAATVPEIRFAATSASRSNLLLAVWLRRLADVHRLEASLEAALRGATILDRTVVLRSIRHMSHAIAPSTLADPEAGVLPLA